MLQRLSEAFFGKHKGPKQETRLTAPAYGKQKIVQPAEPRPHHGDLA